MKAVQLLNHGLPGAFQLSAVPDLQPGPEEVLLRARYCGLNRLDLWLSEVPAALNRLRSRQVLGKLLVKCSAD